MTKKRKLEVPLNRVEGDLRLSVEMDDEQVSDAWSSGLMYRGFERIMEGRGALDGLVITPRICGICSTGHLTAAVRALDMIAGVKLPSDAVRIRNLTVLTEILQSDMRQGFLMFAVDFANPAYRELPLYEEAIRRYRALQGETSLEVIRETEKLLGIIGILGGQWPHSAFMVPGGVTSVPSGSDLLQCRLLLNDFRYWYERRILGCPMERWLEVRSGADLNVWLEERAEHRESDLGFFIRFARTAGLDKMGRGHGNFISFGGCDLPEGTAVRGQTEGNTLIPAGFAQGARVLDFDQKSVTEHVAHSWFVDYPGGKHPFEGETRPYASGREGGKYSWSKAPRYKELPAETGPLAQAVMDRNPLFTDLVEANGPNAFSRELARLTRPTRFIPAMEVWISETTPDGNFYMTPGEILEGRGCGLTEVTRGALGHWVEIQGGEIEHYQIITPTAWNASPRDSRDVRGPMEEALLGTTVKDASNPVELGHVVRSFDPCLVCTVHTVDAATERKSGKTGTNSY